MGISRRLILKSALAITALSGIGSLVARFLGMRAAAPAQRNTLAAYLDTLIPEDNAPGADELGVTQAIINKAGHDPRYLELIETGCAWLDAQAHEAAGTPFAELPEYRREAIVSVAASGRAGYPPFLFFETMWSDACFHYYAQPEAWSTLHYAGPPQPHGFMDYMRPPS